MDSSSTHLHIIDEEDEFDWEAAVREIDVACRAKDAEKPTSTSDDFSCDPEIVSNPVREINRKGKSSVNLSSVSVAKQSTLDRFIGGSKKLVGKAEFSSRNGGIGDDGVSYRNGSVGVDECEYEESVNNGFVKIDPEAAKTWIYPVNVPRRDYQFSITKTALFSNTLVVLPTGLGKTLIAAAVMYNYFRWFPEGKIVFAAPSRPLVMQQIEACHKIAGIPQEWTIDLTGQTNPTRRAEYWKIKRVFFVTPQVLEKDIHSGSCLVEHLVCLVIDEAHRAMGNYAYCVAVRELMDAHVQLRILALTATPGSKQQIIQQVIDNLQISTLEYRNESDPDVIPYVHDRKIELIEVPMGNEAVEITNLLLEVVRPYASRLSSYGVLQKRDIETLSPCELLNSRDKFRQEPPLNLPHTKYGEVEGYFGALLTLYHIRKLLSSHGIRPAFEMLDEKLKQGSFARLMSRNEGLLKAKLLMHQTVSHGAPSPKLAKMLEVLIDHFKNKDPKNSRVIIFSNFRGSVRDILDALTTIRDVVKATEFIGQSSGKTLKGQTQKVQQAVLQKFRTGGYNVIVATSIGEEGLDIIEVDLVICFDANVSSLRMIQRMGRTGRKHEGRAVVLACEGSELKGYMRKQANSKHVKKHMTNGGMNSFNFHSSPRMVPHVFRPEVQFLEMSIEEFVPRGKKVKDDNLVPLPEYKTKLTDAETNLLAKYFTPTGEIAWRPSLIAFPHFQMFPSPVNKVAHSSRTGILIDTMQYLQGLENGSHSAEVEEILDPCSRVEAVEHHEETVEDSEMPDDPVEDKLKSEALQTEVEAIEKTKDMHTENSQKQKPCRHTFLFGSEFVSVDDFGNVLVLSLPQLPLESNSKCIINDSDMGCVFQSMEKSDDPENSTLKTKVKPYSSPSRSHDVVDLLESSQHNPNAQRVKFFSLAENNLPSPVSSTKEMDICSGVQNVDESSDDSRDSGELSPRLTNFIKSGIVPESPVDNPVPLSVPGIREDIQTPILHSENNALESPIPAEKVTETPMAKLSNSSSSKEWLFDSGVKAETVEKQCKFRRLRKLGDLNWKVPPESKKRSGPRRKLRNSEVSDDHTANKFVRGEKKRAKDAGLYIDEEAQVSSEAMTSDEDEEMEQDSSSYEDSFIDDGVNPTSTSTQAVGSSRPDMMAIYRRSLLSQSPFQRLPDFATNVSPDSVVHSSRMDESGSSSGARHDQTPPIGLESTARNCQLPQDSMMPSEMDGNKLETRKRKLSFYQAQAVPMVNLENEFSLLPETTAGENASVQVPRPEEKRNVCYDDDYDDQFYEGIDLDAVEEEAARLLGFKTDCKTQKTTVSDPVEENFANLGSPTFDLGF